MKNELLTKLLIFLFFLLEVPLFSYASPSIRIELLHATRIDVSCPDEFNISLSNGQPVFLGKSATFAAESSGISINGKLFKTDLLLIQPHGIFHLNKHHYRGDLRLHKIGDLLQAINVIDLEEYLYSVVGSEMSSRWPKEALKAQAVVARTYALKKKSERQNLPFDLVGSYQDQAYEGLEGESASTKEAVAATRGEILTYHGEIITAYYHADCGGRTEKGKNVFPGDLPYLPSVVCPYGDDSPYHRWTKGYSLSELSERLGKPIQKVTLSKDSETSRIAQVTLESLKGNEAMSGTAFRKFLGTRDLRSTRFDWEEVTKVALVPKEELLPPKVMTRYVSSTVLRSRKETMVESLTAHGKVFLMGRTGALLETEVSPSNPLVVIARGGFLFTLDRDFTVKRVKPRMVAETLFIPQLVKGPPRKKVVWVEQAVPVGVVFTGSGWGHGVGLCQWGSHGLALLGKTYHDILHFYYHDVEVKKSY